jgi:hypothetical protein
LRNFGKLAGMASGGPKPPKMTRYRDQTYRSLVLAADPEFLTDANRVVEYEMPSRTISGKRLFHGWYKSRGAYAKD